MIAAASISRSKMYVSGKRNPSAFGAGMFKSASSLLSPASRRNSFSSTRPSAARRAAIFLTVKPSGTTTGCFFTSPSTSFLRISRGGMARVNSYSPALTRREALVTNPMTRKRILLRASPLRSRRLTIWPKGVPRGMCTVTGSSRPPGPGRETRSHSAAAIPAVAASARIARRRQRRRFRIVMGGRPRGRRARPGHAGFSCRDSPAG